ncbi:MAG: glycosyltransferase family 4 protein [Candidatus Omnitrophota bacterium]
MNILMVHPHDIFDTAEPWTVRIVSIAREFVKTGHSVKLCYFPVLIGAKHGASVLNGIEVIPFDRTPSPAVFIGNTRRLIGLCGWADVMHFQKCHHYSSVPALAAAYITGKPAHYDWDDWEEKIYYESCGKNALSVLIGSSFLVLERFLPYLSDSVSCASGQLRKMAAAFGAPKERVYASPVGADLSKFSPDSGAGRVKITFSINGDMVLYIGQLHGAQYAGLFIYAAALVLRKKPDVKFIIVGEGYLEGNLRRLASDLGIAGNMIFTGSVPHDAVPRFIGEADVCVAPFDDTAVTRCKSPLKVAEYLACGKPVVASDVGEVSAMVGDAGVLVKPGDCSELAEKILMILMDKELGERLGRLARSRAEENYSWKHTADTLLSAYSGICG